MSELESRVVALELAGDMNKMLLEVMNLNIRLMVDRIEKLERQLADARGEAALGPPPNSPVLFLDGDGSRNQSEPEHPDCIDHSKAGVPEASRLLHASQVLS